MTNIGILSEEKIITLKSNTPVVIEKIKESANNEWLKEFFSEENPFQKSKINIKDFDLLKNEENDSINEHDLENAILLHKNLKITDSQASDERLWISLCFGKFYDLSCSQRIWWIKIVDFDNFTNGNFMIFGNTV